MKIKFVDFWPGFFPHESYFYNLLGGSEKLEISDNPDILFFSNFGSENKKYRCFKIFFSSENERPNMFKCDIALTFDYLKCNRHLRLPLFVLFAHRYNYKPHILKNRDSVQILEEWKMKKFCCMVVSNGKSKKRIDFFNFLIKKERVDSGGKYLNNIGLPIEDKLAFIKNYKFVLSFENSSYPGYTTEKLLEPYLSNSIPVYWGNPKVNNDFNSKSFINVADFKNFAAVYRFMKKIEMNDELIERFLMSNPIYQENAYWNDDYVSNWIMTKFETQRVPIANKLYALIFSKCIDSVKGINYWLREYTFGHFR